MRNEDKNRDGVSPWQLAPSCLPCSSLGRPVGCSPSGQTCSSTCSLQAVAWISTRLWCPSQASRASLLWHLEHFLPLLILCPRCMQGCFSCSFPCSLCGCIALHPFLNLFFQRCHTCCWETQLCPGESCRMIKFVGLEGTRARSSLTFISFRIQL